MSLLLLPLCNSPHETWAHFPYAATMEGQYIIKNLVLVSAGLVIYAAARREAVIEEPGMARAAISTGEGLARRVSAV